MAAGSLPQTPLEDYYGPPEPEPAGKNASSLPSLYPLAPATSFALDISKL
jgi:hypothetical protein